MGAAKAPWVELPEPPLFAETVTAKQTVGKAVGKVILVAVEVPLAFPHWTKRPFVNQVNPFAEIVDVPTVRPAFEPVPESFKSPGWIVV